MDISPIQPTHDVPINCDFLIDNLRDGVPFDTGSVDYAHSRSFSSPPLLCETRLISSCVMAGIPETKWPGYTAEVFRVLKPGTGIACFIEMNPRSRSDDHDVSKLPLRQVLLSHCYRPS